MDNNKLGLKIVRINQGYTELLEINGDRSWTKNVWDIRKGLENIDNLDGSSAVLMLASIDTGHMLTVASLIEGRVTDCISAWIHIPATISISGEELVEIVDTIRKEILANKRNEEKLIQLFSKAYESAPAARVTTKSIVDKCAFRYYGQGAQYTLKELLSDIHQPYYKDYKCVFFIDNSTKLKCLSGENLSNQKVYSQIVIQSPGNVDSFTPHIGGNPFKDPIYATEGGKITVEWKREHFNTIKKTFDVVKGVECPIPSPDEHKMIVMYEAIQVRDEDSTNEIKDYELRIDNQRICAGQKIAIGKDKITRLEVKVLADGYEEYNQVSDLSNGKTIYVNMKKKTFTYNFVLLGKNRKKIIVKYETKGLLRECPIRGYKCSKKINPESDNWLDYKPLTKAGKITLSIILAVALLLGATIGWYCTNLGHKKSINSDNAQISTSNSGLDRAKETKPTAQTQVQPKSDVIDWRKAVEYLDANTEWERTAMEKIVGIQGLWDALNHYKWDNILQYEEDLRSSKNFEKLVRAIGTNEKSFNGTYCNEGDTEITIEKYINKLGPAKPSKTTKQQNNKNVTASSQADW